MPRVSQILPRVFCCALGAFLLLSQPAASQAPLINEFMASNAATVADDDGDYSDWIEIFNPGPSTFDLTDCYLSDDASNPLRWRFPAGSVAPQGYLLVWASGKDRLGPSGALHTNFAISAAGEPLLLTAADGATRLDEVAAIALPADVSYGRLPDGAASWVLFGEPTPGERNDKGLQYLAPPSLSQTPGLYASPVTLALSSPDPTAEIRYTLDGSEPGEASPLYTAPLVLASRDGDPNIISLIPTNDVQPPTYYAWRPPRAEVFKLNLVRARALKPGYAPSAIATGSYIVDPVPAGRLTLPVISLATAPENLFDPAIGIYVPGDTYIAGDIWSGNYHQEGDAWERPVHLEFFDLQGGTLLAQDAGMRIHGGITRAFPQKSLRLYARSEYGTSAFAAALFPELPYDSYKRFLIRNSGNDWSRQGFRDLAVQTVVAHLGFDTQAGRPVVHFLNGEYWGLANVRERYDRHYLARVYGVPEDEAAQLYNNAWVEEGQPSDRNDYLDLRGFVASNDMTLAANLAFVAERMDLENYIAYNVAQIYIANGDWPGNNIRFWRRTRPAYDPAAPYGHDGRWRWMMYDTDFAFGTASQATLAQATTPDGSGWPNPPWSTQLLRGLLENEWFRHTFINTFADHLNSTFVPARVVAIIDDFEARYAPAIAAFQDRWDINHHWASGVQSLRNFANQRPAYQRQHIVDHFQLAGTTPVTLAVNDPAQGKLRLNTLVIDGDLPGLADPAAAYPWTGTCFQGVPIAVEALPAAGHRFVAWLHDGSSDPALTIVPGAAPIALTAVFAPAANQPVVVHAWHFNDLPSGTLTTVAADVSLLGGAVLTYPGTGAGYLDRVSPGSELGALPDTPAGYALRVRNPADTRELVLTLPSTGHQDLALSYAATRTTNGAEEHSVFCQVEPGGAWHAVAEDVAVSEAFQLITHDLSLVAGTADNADLVVKFAFGGANAGGSSGNQRLDNITIMGVTQAGANLPPQVVAPVALQQAIEGGEPLVLDVAGVFSDPEGDPLLYIATSGDGEFATAVVDGSTVTITPLLRGDVWITVSALDGVNDPVAHSFRVLLHPRAAVLSEGSYGFTAWDPDLPERTYPEHMLFLQSAVNDPGLSEPLLFPYWIAHDDYHADDQGTIGYPYNNTGRTRINGLDQDGISFINTGRGRDLGGAVLALDTRGLSEAQVGWLAGTVLPNERIYAIRLQYRLGIEGQFSDLLLGGQAQEYLRSETAGDVVVFPPLDLPAELLGHAYLQLMWRYYHVSGASGPRAELRLDEIHLTGVPEVTGVEAPPLPPATALHGNAPNPFNPATEIRFGVKAGETATLAIYNSRGQRVRDLGRFAAGRHAARWDGADANGARCASGIYFCRLSSPSASATRKMVLVK